MDLAGIIDLKEMFSFLALIILDLRTIYHGSV